MRYHGHRMHLLYLAEGRMNEDGDVWQQYESNEEVFLAWDAAMCDAVNAEIQVIVEEE